jgi:histidyl-tRNA synthetase
MRFDPETVKGFQDFLPPESQKRTAIVETIKKYFKLYGFLPIETPLIEFDELMRPDSQKEEDEAVSDRFRLKDRAGRNLGLRYEFTFQLARIFKQNPNIKLPLRRFQIGPVFRDEPTSSTRFKQFTQCDADILGDSSINAELDCLLLVSDILKELKIPAEIEINSRSLLSALIDGVQIQDKSSVFRELDKMEKLGEYQIKANLKKYASTTQIVTLFKLLDKGLDFYRKNAFEGAEDLYQLLTQAKKQKIPIKFNPFMIRGLGYYTGNIFEVKLEGEKNTIVAGGRYDKTVGKFLNQEIPAVGISFGLERLSILTKNIKTQTTKTIIISLNQLLASQKLAKTLRKATISCLISERNPGKALDYANAYNIQYAIFIGDEEIQQKKFKLKELFSGKESMISEKQLVKKLSK